MSADRMAWGTLRDLEPVPVLPTKEQAACCVARALPDGRLPIGLCSPECVRRRYPRPTVTGERNPAAKLTDAQTQQIRDRYKSGELQQALADEFGVTQVRVSQIVRRG